jgi:hypothetical protein
MSNPNNANWSLRIPPLADAAIIDPTRVGLPTGAYAVRIDSVTQKPAKEAGAMPSLQFDCTVIEGGEFQGRTVSLYAGTDLTKKGNQNTFKTILASCGARPESFNQQLDLGPASFQGRNAYIHVQAKPEGSQEYDERRFVVVDVYQKVKANGNVAATAAHPTTAGVPQLGAPAGIPAMGAGIPQPSNGVAGLGNALGVPAPATAPAAGVGGVGF